MSDLDEFQDVVASIRSNLAEMTLNRPAPTPSLTAKAPRHGAGWRWAIAGAALVVLAVVPVAFLLRGGDEGSDEPTTSVPVTAVAESSGVQGWIDWEALDLLGTFNQPAAFDPFPGLLTAGDAWVAPTPDQIGEASPVTGYWTSTDGRQWSFARIDPMSFGMNAAYLRDITGFGDKVYAIAKGQPIEDGTPNEVVVVSTGGSDWIPLSDPAIPSSPLMLASGPRGLLVVARGPDGPPSWTIAVSLDGRSWTRSTTNLDGVTGPIGAITSDAFYIGGEEPLQDTAAVVWASTDGANWRSIPLPGDPNGAATPVPSAAGLLARYRSPEGSMRLFHLEPGGETFVDVTPVGVEPTWVETSPGDGLVVVQDDQAPDRPILWSEDLTTWYGTSLLPLIGDRWISELAVLGDTVLMNTYVNGPGQDQPGEWLWYRGTIRRLGPDVEAPGTCGALVGTEPWLVLFTRTYPGPPCVRVGLHQDIQLWNKGFDATRIEWDGSIHTLNPDEFFATGTVGEHLEPGTYTFAGEPYALPEIHVVDPESSKSANLTVTDRGWGPVDLGMTIADATQALGSVIAVQADLAPGPECWQAVVVGDPYTPIFTVEGGIDDTGVIIGVTSTYPTTETVGAFVDPERDGACVGR